MRQLTWEQVVEYAFLADFDILRDTRAEIQACPWTRPAYRLALDKYFRIQRAKEEIRRLNIEIHRVIAWIRDEDHTLQRKGRELRCSEGKSEEQHRGRFDDAHMHRFWALAKMPGFSGSIVPGTAVEVLQAGKMDVDNEDGDEVGREEGEDEGDEARDAEVSGLLYRISMLTVDGAREGEE
ncbi:hypothetical protein FB451DRAFT_1169614 [Mycena latifolia]|nr:hypothetical protein FB451DRAFT_1169614 [Mycena latifolia]